VLAFEFAAGETWRRIAFQAHQFRQSQAYRRSTFSFDDLLLWSVKIEKIVTEQESPLLQLRYAVISSATRDLQKLNKDLLTTK